MKRSRILAGFICLALILAALPLMSACAAKAPEQITLTLVTPLPSFIKGQWASYELVDRVNERAGGRLVIDYLGGPEVIGTLDQPEAVRTGAVDILHTWSILYMARVPEAYCLPFAQIPTSEMRENGFYDWMSEVHETGMNVYFLGLAQFNRWFYIFLTEPASTLNELKGRTIISYDLDHAKVRALGMTPVFMAMEDYYDAMERGIADGYCSPFSDADEFGLAPVGPYVILPGTYGVSNVPILVNLDKWNTLPKDLQQLMIDVMREIEEEVPTYFEEYDAAAFENLKRDGVEVVRFSPEESAYYENICYEAGWNEIKPKLSAESYEKLRKLLMVREDYTGMWETRGWGEWPVQPLYR